MLLNVFTVQSLGRYELFRLPTHRLGRYGYYSVLHILLLKICVVTDYLNNTTLVYACLTGEAPT